MSADEIVKALKELLPEKIDYAELVASPVPPSYGMCYVWDDPEPYIIESGIDCIEHQQNKIAKLTAICKDAIELLEAAQDEAWRKLGCENCGNHGCAKTVGIKRKCLGGDGSWRWRFDERYETLKAQFSETT